MLQLSIFQASMESVFVQFCQSLFFVSCGGWSGSGLSVRDETVFITYWSIVLKSPETTKEKLRLIQGMETKAEYEIDPKLMSKILKRSSSKMSDEAALKFQCLL